MKRLIAVILALLLLLALSACGGSGTAKENARPGDQSPGEMTGETETPDPNAEPELQPASAAAEDWWDGYWYGWWAIRDSSGSYAPANNIAWDAYAHIERGGDSGSLLLWDTGTREDHPLMTAELAFDAGASQLGRMNPQELRFFPEGDWNEGMAAVPMTLSPGDWSSDPADSTVSHFENTLEIVGHYESPENPEDAFDYYIYLRPWGQNWEIIRNGDTSGCLYSDMMPLYYEDWYLPLLNLGYEQPPASFEEGWSILEGASAAALDPSMKEGADGEVDLATLERALPWCKRETSYSTTYEEVAAQFGVHGKKIDSLFEGKSIYRWWSGEAYIQITFDLHEDGSETWNVTQYDGLS